MTLAQFCKNCNCLLGDINIETGIMKCIRCKTPHKLPDDNKNIMYFNGSGQDMSRSISEIEARRLAELPTTYNINKKCSKCGFDIVASIYDDNYRFTFVCIKCKTIF